MGVMQFLLGFTIQTEFKIVTFWKLEKNKVNKVLAGVRVGCLLRSRKRYF